MNSNAPENPKDGPLWPLARPICLSKFSEMLGSILELGISWEKLYNIDLTLCIKNLLPFAKNH
jgi:hypothetical protein